MRGLLQVRFIVLMVLLFIPTLVTQAEPIVGGCQIFPSDNPWNTNISAAPVDPRSAQYIANINANGGDYVHPDFGSDPTYGIPYITVPKTQPKVPVTFDYDDESDPGPYPIPPDAPVEGGGDRHVIVIVQEDCILYEMYASEFVGGLENAWEAGSGAKFDLNSNALRPEGWTSADAAGLPIFPGLARCDEAESGEITHALRFTVSKTQRAYIYPARHFASNNTGLDYPPMGLRLRLKANYDLSNFTGQALVIATALKQYGMILADNGSNWYISGETNPDCWDDDEDDGDDDDLNQLKQIPGTAFEVVQTVETANAAPKLYYSVIKRPTLTWNRISWATGYQIQVSRDPSFSGAVIHDVSANTFSYTPSTDLSDGLYYWRVRGVGGDGTWGTPATFFVNT